MMLLLVIIASDLSSAHDLLRNAAAPAPFERRFHPIAEAETTTEMSTEQSSANETDTGIVDKSQLAYGSIQEDRI